MRKQIYVANVGDCQLYIYKNSLSKGKNPLCLHNTSNKKEISRIQSAFPKAVFADGYYAEPNSPNCGLSITRSLGHKYMSKFGITHTPDIHIESLEPPFYLVMGSDGIWDSHNGVKYNPFDSNI